MNLSDTSLWVALLASTVRLSTPLVLAALGGLFSERSGVINIALEGTMLIGAFAAAAGNLATGSPWLGAAIGITAACLFSMLHAVASIHWRANQVVSGMAINILAAGTVPLLGKVLYDSTGSTPAIGPEQHFSEWSIPFFSKIPILGAILGTHTPIVFIALAIVVIVHFWFYKTAGGLRLQAVGEHPDAADSVGVAVIKTRYKALLISGILCGLAGAFLSIGNGANYTRNMTAGRGFIAITALIFGKWRPVPTFLACLLFGFTDAFQIRMQGVAFPIVGEIPPQFVQALPYLVTIIVLAGFIGSSKPPKALGVPYVKEE